MTRKWSTSTVKPLAKFGLVCSQILSLFLVKESLSLFKKNNQKKTFLCINFNNVVSVGNQLVKIKE